LIAPRAKQPDILGTAPTERQILFWEICAPDTDPEGKLSAGARSFAAQSGEQIQASFAGEMRY